MRVHKCSLKKHVLVNINSRIQNMVPKRGICV
jgi:hypothetical protein